ncbi:MAG: hypothetical protein HZB53_05755 [Chloroflexi bacterium]|nr:hypothetical protein [Chloroflexota bacterium]
MIRSFSLQDAALVSQLQSSGTTLDLRRALLWPQNSLASAVMTFMPLGRHGARTLVMRESLNGAPVAGFVQYRERHSQPEADILFCAPAIDRADAEANGQHIWHRLMSALTVRLGEGGCQRLYARVLDGASELDLFWQLGFSAYARERVFAREGMPADPPRAASVWRPQRSRDAWAVGQLYAAVTPKLVQQAENLPRADALAPYRESFGYGIDRRYVVAQADEISASLRVIRGQQRCWLQLMINPAALDRADELVRDALALAPAGAQAAYLSVREYQSELQGAIRRAGFADFESEMMMVKHTTVMVKKAVLKPLPVIEGIEVRPTGIWRHTPRTSASAPAERAPLAR